MTPSRAARRAITVLALALAFGPAAAATAKPIDTYSGGAKPPAPYTSGISYTTAPATPGSTGTGSEWPYVAIGAGAAGLALVGVAGTVTASQRRHRRERRSRTTIAT